MAPPSAAAAPAPRHRRPGPAPGDFRPRRCPASSRRPDRAAPDSRARDSRVRDSRVPAASSSRSRHRGPGAPGGFPQGARRRSPPGTGWPWSPRPGVLHGDDAPQRSRGRRAEPARVLARAATPAHRRPDHHRPPPQQHRRGPGHRPSRQPEDPGVSHQHAVLVQQPDGSWAVVDQDSTNGTTINLAEDPIQPFVPVPLQDGDRVHVGAWTTITVRRG
ncbi:FHA domain-containing protein [Streptomyces sp. M19]